MIERPILFSGAMVRALLAGTKTQTRRVVKPQPQPNGGAGLHPVAPYRNPYGLWAWVLAATGHGSGGDLFACPYGQPGDRLWVRETHYAWGRWETRFSVKKGRDEWHFVDMTLESGKAYLHPATDPQPQPMGGKRHKGGVTPTWWKRPAIFMPRAASRITLEVTEVRVERLQDISRDDAKAEGCAHDDPCDHTRLSCADIGCAGPDYRIGFRHLWEQINGPGSWEGNPWVWAVSFKLVKGGGA